MRLVWTPQHDGRAFLCGYQFSLFSQKVQFKAVPIEKGKARTCVLPRRMLDPEALGREKVRWGDSADTAITVSVDEWLRRTESDALVVLHDGQIVAEQYFGEMTPQTRHAIWCGSKSFLATVLAPFLCNGLLDEGVQVTEYVHEFLGTGFEGATVRHLLDYVTSLAYEEVWDSSEPEWVFGTPEFRRAEHDFARCNRVSGCLPALPDERNMGYYDFLFALKAGDRDHGTLRSHSDPCSMALELILERATETPYLEHLNRFWRALGPENIATMMVDHTGTLTGTFGLFVTARDWARWGQMVCNLGRVADGFVLPGIRELVDDVHENSGPRETLSAMPDPGYRSQFWTASVEPGRLPLIYGNGAYHRKKR